MIKIFLNVRKGSENLQFVFKLLKFDAKWTNGVIACGLNKKGGHWVPDLHKKGGLMTGT